MKIYIRNDFREILNTPGRVITLGNYKLGTLSSSSYTTLEDIDQHYMESEDVGRSPTVGYYRYNYIKLGDDKYQFSLTVPSDDAGIKSSPHYRVLYGLYTELENTPRLGFIGVMDGFTYLDILMGTNIIDIPLHHECIIAEDKYLDDDSNFLEGPGNNTGSYSGMYAVGGDEAGVNKGSYLEFLKAYRDRTNFSYLDTVGLNEFGLKIY